MIKIKDKYKGGFKHAGVQYYLDEKDQNKLQSLFNTGSFNQFLEQVIEEKEFFEDKLIKPKKKKEQNDNTEE